jgi:hypothetical protein
VCTLLEAVGTWSCCRRSAIQVRVRNGLCCSFSLTERPNGKADLAECGLTEAKAARQVGSVGFSLTPATDASVRVWEFHSSSVAGSRKYEQPLGGQGSIIWINGGTSYLDHEELSSIKTRSGLSTPQWEAELGLPWALRIPLQRVGRLYTELAPFRLKDLERVAAWPVEPAAARLTDDLSTGPWTWS